MKHNILKVSLIFSAFAMLGGGIFLQQKHIADRAEEAKTRKQLEAQQAMLDQLRENPLFAWSATDWSHNTPQAALDYARAAEKVGIDPMACYLMVDPGSDLRCSLAYILIVGQTEMYLERAEKNLDTIPAAEVQLWVDLSEIDKSPVLTTATITQLRKLAMASPTPPGLWLAAGQYHQAGLLEDAAEYWKKLLDSPSVQGIAAAEALSIEGIQAQAARKYLWQMAETSESDELQAEAIYRLVKVAHGQDWIEYRRYQADPSPTNTTALLAKLKSASPQAG